MKPATPPQAISPPPLSKSRRGLLMMLAFLLALWIGMMVVMYFGTVYPRTHPPKPAASAAVDAKP
jgi:hypothetical protein